MILDGVVWSTLQFSRSAHPRPLSSVPYIEVDDEDIFIGGEGILVDAWVDMVAPSLSTLLLVSNIVEALCDFDPCSLPVCFN